VLVGCGPRGQSQAEGLLANPDRFELTAVCDLDAGRADSLAAKLGVPRSYADSEAMFAAEHPDVLCFATSPAVRLPLVEAGVRHGVRAIAFEKPLALSLGEARSIVDLCDGRIKAVVCHQLTHAAHWRKVKEIVDGGEIGRVRTIHAAARPSMLRVGTHLVDAMLWLSGGPRALWADGRACGSRAYLEDHPCPDHLAGVVGLSVGARGILEIGSLAPRRLPEGEFWSDVAVTVTGEDGWARVGLGEGWQALTRQAGGRLERGPLDPTPGEAEHLRLLADWLDDPARVHPSNLLRAYEGFEILMGLALSSLERRRVEFPLAASGVDILGRLRETLSTDP